MLRFFSLAILIQKRLAMLQSFFLAILTALTIAVVGSIAWEAGQLRDDLAAYSRIAVRAVFLPVESFSPSASSRGISQAMKEIQSAIPARAPWYLAEFVDGLPPPCADVLFLLSRDYDGGDKEPLRCPGLPGLPIDRVPWSPDSSI
jgi:hypothetical protein